MTPHILPVTAPGTPRLSDVLRLSQMAATSHLDALGLTGRAEAEGLVWVIIRIHGEIYGPISGSLTAETWPGVAKSGFLPRYCRLFDESGRLVASLVTVWVLADAKSRTLAAATLPIPDLTTGNELPIPRSLPRKRMETAGSFTVKPEWIDENGHMNNSCYPLAAEEVLGCQPLPKAFWLDYRHELLPGQTAELSALREEDTLFVSATAEKEYFRMKLQF